MLGNDPGNGQFFFGQQRPGPAGGGQRLADGFLEILRGMGQAGQEKSLTGEIDRPQFDVGLQ